MLDRIVWTAPTGHAYVTKPGGSLFFPQLASPTGTLVLPERVVPPGEHRMMPTRKRSRAQERACRVRWERGLNLPRIAAAEAAAAAAAAADPPPF